MRLNLGASDRHIVGFLCIDIAPSPCPDCDASLAFDGWSDTFAPRTVDLSQPWPWSESSIEEILALDVVEHLPNRIHTMNELHRVLVPGGRVTIETPNANYGCGFIQDPTHCAPFCLSTFKYFEKGAFAHTRLAKSYGITAAFRVLSLTERLTNGEDGREESCKITAVLEAIG